MSTFAALGRMSLTVGAACSGTMPRFAECVGRNSFTGFVDSTLRGVGMAGFANNPISGALFLAAAFSISSWLGCAVLFASAVSTGFALALSIDRHDIRAGLYGYNGALVGGGLATFLAPPWDVAVICCIAVGAALSTLLMAGLIHVMARQWGVPPVAIPFNVIVIVALLARQSADSGSVVDAAPSTEAAVNMTDAVMHGIGQVIFGDTVAAAALVLVGILVCCWWSALLAIIGSAAATLTALALGADPAAVNLGILGLNGFLTCVALGGIFVERRSVYTLMFGILGACASAIAALAFNRVLADFGLPGSITLAYCLITPLLVGAKNLAPRLDAESSAPATTTPATPPQHS